MSFPVSPGVNFREIDVSATVSEQISSNGSIAGQFSWGPAFEITRVSSEDQLVSLFGRPKQSNFLDFFTASSFLAYSSALDVVRIVDRTEALNAVASGSPALVANDEEYNKSSLTGVDLIAKHPGVFGNNIGVSYVTSPAQYERAFTVGSLQPFEIVELENRRSNTVTYTRPTPQPSITTLASVGDFLVIAGEAYEITALTDDFVAPSGGNSFDRITLNRIYTGSLTLDLEDYSIRWRFSGAFGAAPTTNQVYLAVFDATGSITSQVGTVLETFVGTKTIGEKNEDGTSAYIDDVISTSQFVRVGADSLAASVATSTTTVTLTGGVDSTVETDDILAGYDLFKNKEEVSAPLIIAGPYGIVGKGATGNAVVANYLIQNIAEVRKDSVVFISPSFESVVNNKGKETTDVLANRALLSSCSYGAIDSGWKYMYDKYNDTFRWIPLCGDHAGIYARVDREVEPWFSAGGSTRGLIKNVVKLAWNPDQAARDILYPKDVNPVFNVPGVGPAVFGNKTLLGKNSVFSRIQTRRLFIILETVITEAARNLLFEFNDEFSQNRFVSIVEPFLRDIKGRRGIEDFAVIADSSVNTPQVVQNNRFVGRIFIKPLYSIEFIRLDFVAVGASVEFSTVINQA